MSFKYFLRRSLFLLPSTCCHHVTQNFVSRLPFAWRTIHSILSNSHIFVVVLMWSICVLSNHSVAPLFGGYGVCSLICFIDRRCVYVNQPAREFMWIVPSAFDITD